MLRRKLFLTLGSLLTLMVVTVVGAIWTLEGVLRDLRHLDTEAWVVVEEANQLATTISLVEIELYELELGKSRHLDGLIDLVGSMNSQVAGVERSYVSHLSENRPIIDRLKVRLPDFSGHVAGLGTAGDAVWAARHREDALRGAVEMRKDILTLCRNVRQHGEGEQAALAIRFRWLVLGLSIVFTVLINVSIIVLLRMAGSVLRPVEKLVEATRELAQERFNHRVDIDQQDEFGELGRAYNSMAEQLQVHEAQRLETLGQVALTLNHELNNAVSIIELQFQLLNRQSAGNPALEKYAKQIRESLSRMTRTVEALKHVRRIVLTEYVAGVKMLDLERSVAAENDPILVNIAQSKGHD